MHNISKSLPESDQIARHWNAKEQQVYAHVNLGECYITQKKEVMTTVLGSCVTVCLYDPESSLAGMNHFLLPKAEKFLTKGSQSRNSLRYGRWAMEYLVTKLVEHGGKRKNIVAKIFGGASILGSKINTSIGEQNIHFALQYLAEQRIPVITQDTGGIKPRRLFFDVSTGQTSVTYQNNPMEFPSRSAA